MVYERENFAKEKKEKILKELYLHYGADFGNPMSRYDLGYSDTHLFGYQPSYEMPNVFSHISVDPNDSILDVGCGKGFAMHLFSQFPFHKIDGIESNKQLVQIAKKNLKALHPNDSRFRIFHMDARLFDHYADYNVLYLYNPFDKYILDEICQKFGKDLPKMIIYQMPLFKEVFTNNGFKITFEADASSVLIRQ